MRKKRHEELFLELDRIDKKYKDKEKLTDINSDYFQECTRACLKSIGEKSLPIFKKDGKDAGVYLRDSLGVLFTYNKIFLKPNNIELPVDLPSMIDALQHISGHVLKSQNERKEIGKICYLLWLFGSSRNQSVLSTSDFFKCSETKVKSSLREIIKDYEGTGIFPFLAHSATIHLIDKLNDHDFIERSNFSKAKQAWKNINSFYSEFPLFHKGYESTLSYDKKLMMEFLVSLSADIVRRSF